MSQVTYTVGIIGSDNSLLYSGTLLVQIVPPSFGGNANALAGLLSLKSFDPLLLATVQGGGGSGWNFQAGSNAQVSVSSVFFYQIDQGQEPTPTRIGGSIAISVSGQPEQSLSILGFIPPAPAASQNASLELKADAAPTLAVDTYDYKLTLLDDSFAPSGGSGRIQATGQWVRIGVVGRRYEVSGTLTLDQPVLNMPVSGGGTSLAWTASGTEGNDSVVLTLVPGGSKSDGSLTLNGKQFFFVGSPA